MTDILRCGLWLACLVAASMTAAPVAAQPAGCTLSPDEHNRSEKVLRCGDSLTIRSTPGAKFELNPEGAPSGAKLDSGALMIEFKPTDQRKDFQIMSPQSIAAVRGTRWVVDVTRKQTSTLVLEGSVEVRRPAAAKGVLLRPGDGTDVKAGKGPVTVKRWGRKRVDALLARFGQ